MSAERFKDNNVEFKDLQDCKEFLSTLTPGCIWGYKGRGHLTLLGAIADYLMDTAETQQEEIARLKEERESFKQQVNRMQGAATADSFDMNDLETRAIQAEQERDKYFNRNIELAFTIKQIIGDLTPVEFVTEIIQNQNEFRRTLDENQRLTEEKNALLEGLKNVRSMFYGRDRHAEMWDVANEMADAIDSIIAKIEGSKPDEQGAPSNMG